METIKTRDTYTKREIIGRFDFFVRKRSCENLLEENISHLTLGIESFLFSKNLCDELQINAIVGCRQPGAGAGAACAEEARAEAPAGEDRRLVRLLEGRGREAEPVQPRVVLDPFQQVARGRALAGENAHLLARKSKAH